MLPFAIFICLVFHCDKAIDILASFRETKEKEGREKGQEEGKRAMDSLYYINEFSHYYIKKPIAHYRSHLFSPLYQPRNDLLEILILNFLFSITFVDPSQFHFLNIWNLIFSYKAHITIHRELTIFPLIWMIFMFREGNISTNVLKLASHQPSLKGQRKHNLRLEGNFYY